MVFQLSRLLSSRSRVAVLETLHHQPQPVGLRQVAYISELAVRSVECALKQLVDEGIVVRQRKGREVLFSLNHTSPLYEFVTDLCELAERYQIHLRASHLSDRAEAALSFSTSAVSLVGRARDDYERRNGSTS